MTLWLMCSSWEKTCIVLFYMSQSLIITPRPGFPLRYNVDSKCLIREIILCRKVTKPTDHPVRGRPQSREEAGVGHDTRPSGLLWENLSMTIDIHLFPQTIL